jgi:hypothetical protein
MHRVTVIACCLVLPAAFAQNNGGTITGTVTEPTGVTLADAQVRAKNATTGKMYQAASSAQGQYTLSGLPAGAYDLSVNVPGLVPFEQKNVSVEPGKTQRIDLRVRENTQFSTLGEDRTAVAEDLKKHNAPVGPAPRTAEGKPDFSGVWWSPSTVDGGQPEFLPQAVQVAKDRADNNRIDSPQSHCLPGAVLRLGPLFQFVQSKQFLIEISDDDYPGFHQIYLDGRKIPKDLNPAWYGHSFGHWDGDTLVVDRTGFDNRVWLDQDLHPHTDKLHVVERYRRPDAAHMDIEITVDDPGILAKPWTLKRRADLAPTEEIYEFICNENNKDLPHMFGK